MNDTDYTDVDNDYDFDNDKDVDSDDNFSNDGDVVADFPAVFFHISRWYLSWNTQLSTDKSKS